MVEKILLLSNNKTYSLKPTEIKHITNMTSNTLPAPLVASASSQYNTTLIPFRAFNGNNTDANSWATINNTKTGWIQIDYGAPRLSNYVYVTNRNNTDFATTSPKDFNILGSNDGVNFTKLAEIRNQTNWTQNQTREFKLVKPNKYRYMRLEILDNNGATYTAIGEILYSYIDLLSELPSASVDNFINHGIYEMKYMDLINSSKNYILLPSEGNTGGVFEQIISRKPLTISSTNKLAILHNGNYYTTSDGTTLVPLTSVSEVEALGFTSLTISQDIYDLVGENPTVVAYSNNENDITVSTTTESFDMYDEFGDEVEVMYYTDDESATDADLTLEANWSPIDELEGDFEVVTWTDEDGSVAQRVLEVVEYNDKAIPTLVIPTGDVSLFKVDTIDSLQLTASANAKVVISFDRGLTWLVYRDGAWATVDNAHDGMLTADFNALTPEQLNELRGDSNTIRFSYSLMNDEYTDKVVMTVSLQGVEELAKTKDFEVSYNQATRTITYLIKKNGTYSINYIDGI